MARERVPHQLPPFSSQAAVAAVYFFKLTCCRYPSGLAGSIKLPPAPPHPSPSDIDIQGKSSLTRKSGLPPLSCGSNNLLITWNEINLLRSPPALKKRMDEMTVVLLTVRLAK